LDNVSGNHGSEDLASLLPDYPEIGGNINFNQEITSLEKGSHSLKEEIL
jgi:hypothetical protein